MLLEWNELLYVAGLVNLCNWTGMSVFVYLNSKPSEPQGKDSLFNDPLNLHSQIQRSGTFQTLDKPVNCHMGARPGYFFSNLKWNFILVKSNEPKNDKESMQLLTNER